MMSSCFLRLGCSFPECGGSSCCGVVLRCSLQLDPKMQADDEKMFLENIEEFVMDEGKIVTYKWLSATLDLHVNTAKQLLYQYAMPNNKRKDGVHMTYLVAGALADGSGMRIQIVRENDLDDVKSQFNIITSEHVYSVQKASHLPDLNILYGVDNLKNEKNFEDRFGAIRCSKAVRRLENDIKSLQIKARAATAVATNSVSSSKKASGAGLSVSTSSSSEKERSEPVTEGLGLPISSSKTKESEPTKPVESKSSNVPSIASLFTAQAKASKTNDKAVSAAGNNKPAAKKAKGGGIAMFFTKQSEKQTINTEQKETLQDLKTIVKENNTPIDKMPPAVETIVSIDNKKPASTKKKLSIEMDVDKEKTNPKSDMKEKKGKNSQKVETNGKQTSSSRRGKKKKSSENSQPAKKRKRIMVISDDSASSDEDIFGSDSDTEMRPPSPEILPEAPPKSHSSDEDIIPSTPISQQIRNGKMRKRKLVEKTFEDKDGFIVTKKEFVLESCSEDDGENEKQASTTPNQIPAGLVVENDKTNKSDDEIKDDVPIHDVEKDKPAKKKAKGEKQTKKKKALPPVGQKSHEASETPVTENQDNQTNDSSTTIPANTDSDNVPSRATLSESNVTTTPATIVRPLSLTVARNHVKPPNHRQFGIIQGNNIEIDSTTANLISEWVEFKALIRSEGKDLQFHRFLKKLDNFPA